MDDPMRRPVIEVRGVFADGERHTRTWTINDTPHPDLAVDTWPEWMIKPRRSWQHPQDPIIYSFLVESGREDDAKSWIDGL